MKKKVISLLTTVTMFIPLASSFSFAESYGALTYSVNYDNTITVTDCEETAERVTIPAEIDSLPVTVIGSEAFEGCAALTSITIPSSVKRIESYAFSSCKALTEITIPDSVGSIGERAFSSCTKLKSIIIPANVEFIGYDAFYSCTSLADIYYGGKESQWTVLSEENRERLSAVTVHFASSEATPSPTAQPTAAPTAAAPTIVPTITPSPTPLAESTEPPFIIPTSAPNETPSATPTETPLATPDALPTATPMVTPSPTAMPTLTPTAVPDTTLRGSCGDDVSYTLTQDGTLTISGVGEMSDMSFDAYIPWYSSRYDITRVVIENGVTSIGSGAFINCTNLTDVEISGSVKTINILAFYGCGSLRNVYYTGSKYDWNHLEINSGNENLTSAVLHYGVDTPNKIEVVKDYADNVTVETALIGNRLVFALKSLDGEDLSEMHMYIAEYNEDKTLKRIRTGTNVLSPDGVTVIADLPEEDYRLFLWDKDMRPVIDTVISE